MNKPIKLLLEKIFDSINFNNTEIYFKDMFQLEVNIRDEKYNKLGTLIFKDRKEGYLFTNYENTILDYKKLIKFIKNYKNDGYVLESFCFGNDIWFYCNWKGLNNLISWTDYHNYALYGKVENMKNSYDSNNQILKNYDIKYESIFKLINDEHKKDMSYDLYIPNEKDLRYIFNIVNEYNLYGILKLSRDNYWSCSQYEYGKSNYANLVSFYDGGIFAQCKQYRYRSIGLIKFNKIQQLLFYEK